jgi:phage terminase large subunit
VRAVPQIAPRWPAVFGDIGLGREGADMDLAEVRNPRQLAQAIAVAKKRGLPLPMPKADANKSEALARYKIRPDDYAREVLGIEWWSKQIEIAYSVMNNRRTVVYAGHSVGKTHGVAGLAQWHFDCFAPSITLTTAPNWSAIHDLLWGEIKAQRPQGLTGRLLDLLLEAGPMHYCKGHNAESSAGFQGRHEERVMVVLDEAMGIEPFIWEATDAMMTSPNCRVLALGNPTETSGEYYNIREDPNWSVITISCLEHPNIAAELAGQVAPFPKAVSLTWLNEMLNKHAPLTTEHTADDFEFPPGSGLWHRPNDIFRSRVLGLFPKQASNAVWSEAWINVARTANLMWSDNDPPEIGVDVARYGDDKTTLYARRGPVVTHAEEYAKQDLMETTGRVVRLADRVADEHKVEAKKIDLKIDDTGLGGGVTDRLKELKYKAVPITAGDAAIDQEEYFNRRSELWFTTAGRARERRLDLSRLPEARYKTLAAELRAVRYKIQSDKSLRVESKDEYKKRLKRSPDDADGLNLAFAGTVAKKLKTGANPFFG